MTIRQRIRDRLRPSFDFTMTGPAAFVAEVPHVAHYSHPDVHTAIAQADPARPVLGLAAHGPVHAPEGHLLVTDGAGGGRSTVLRTVGAQALRHGHRVVVLDSKGRSHRWAVGLEGVDYARTIDEVTATLVELAAEMRARNAVLDRDPSRLFRPVTVLAEDIAVALGVAERRHRDAGHNGRSDAQAAFGDLLYAGRAAGVRVVATGHMLTANAGPEAREQFAAHLVGARTMQGTWRMLGLRRPDPMPTHQGRYHLVHAGHMTPFQALYLTYAEARLLAGSGREVTP